MALDFQPGLVSGGKLSEAEYLSRKQQCTQQALASLQASAEFKRWEQQRRRPFAAAHPTLAAAAVALTVLLAASMGAYAFWGKSAAVAAVGPDATGLQQPAAGPGELSITTSQLDFNNVALSPKASPEHTGALQFSEFNADKQMTGAAPQLHSEASGTAEAQPEQPGVLEEPALEQPETETQPAQQEQQDAAAEATIAPSTLVPPAEDSQEQQAEEEQAAVIEQAAAQQAQAELQRTIEDLRQRAAQQAEQTEELLAQQEAALRLKFEETLIAQKETHQRALESLQDALRRAEAQAATLEQQLERELAHGQALSEQLKREQAQGETLSQQLWEQEAHSAAVSQQLSHQQEHARELQEALGHQQAQAKSLAQHLADTVAEKELAISELDGLRADHSTLQAQLQEQRAQLVQAAAAVAAAQAAPQLPQCPLDGPLSISEAEETTEGTCPNGVPPAVVGAWPELYVLYSAATLVLLGVVAAWRLHVRSMAAAGASAAAEKAKGGEAAKLLAKESVKVAQLQKELAAVKQEAAALAEGSEAWEAARKEKEGLEAQLEQAHQALLQVQSELEQQLQDAREEAASKAQEAEQEREAFLEAQAQLEEQREWHNAAQELAVFTASALSAAYVDCKGAASPLRAISPTKRAPLAARSRNSSLRRLRSLNDENSPAMASPLPGGAGQQHQTPSIAAAAAAALAAKRADTPRAWLDLLQARFAAVRDQAAAAERSAMEAEAALDTARKENSWHQQKVSEMVTDIELLKERLADAKRGFQTATAEERQAKEAAALLQASLEELEGQAGSHAKEREQLSKRLSAAEGQQAELSARLEAAEAERAQLAQRLEEAQAQMEGLRVQLEDAQAHGGSGEAELAAKLAQREGEAAELEEAVAALERENSSLEAQADQVTAVLEHTQRQKAELEKRVAQLEQELSNLTLLTEKLEGDKAVLEEQLEEARRSHAELCAAGKQLAAAESTIHHINRRSETPDAETDLRRAISEKVAALDLLASAEKIMLEREAEDDLAPLPAHSNLRSTSRAGSAIGSLDDSFTPRSRGQKMFSYFSSKLDRVARLMSGDPNGDRESMPGTPRSISSAPGGMGLAALGAASATPASLLRGGSMGGHRMTEGVSAWIDRLNQSFSHVDRVLHQDLAGFETPSVGTVAGGHDGSPVDGPPRSEGVDRAQEALEYSAAEVIEVLAALDAAEQMDGHTAQVAAVKEELHAAHMAVQAAMREVQSCNGDLELRKGSHRDMLQEFQRLSGQVELASELVDSEVQVKAQMEERVQGAQERLAAAEAELERALQQKLAAEAALGEETDGEGEDGELWEARLATNHEYERCLVQQRACLEEMQSALAAKKEALERLGTASARLEAAEVQHEDMADALDRAEADLRSLAQQRLAAAGALSAAQRRQSAALQLAVGALERCLSPAEDGDDAAESSNVTEEREGENGYQIGVESGEPPAKSPASPPEASQGSSGRSAGSQAAVRSPAEVAAVLLDEGWGWETPNSLASRPAELYSL